MEDATELLRDLLALVEHETSLPQSAYNGVRDDQGKDEGVIKAAEVLDRVKAHLSTVDNNSHRYTTAVFVQGDIIEGAVVVYDGPQRNQAFKAAQHALSAGVLIVRPNEGNDVIYHVIPPCKFNLVKLIDRKE